MTRDEPDGTAPLDGSHSRCDDGAVNKACLAQRARRALGYGINAVIGEHIHRIASQPVGIQRTCHHGDCQRHRPQHIATVCLDKGIARGTHDNVSARGAAVQPSASRRRAHHAVDTHRRPDSGTLRGCQCQFMIWQHKIAALDMGGDGGAGDEMPRRTVEFIGDGITAAAGQSHFQNILTPSLGAGDATIVQRAAGSEQMRLVGSQQVNPRHQRQPSRTDVTRHIHRQPVTLERQRRRLDARETVAGGGHISADPVGIGQRGVTHAERVAHPQICTVNQADSPSHQHRCGVIALGESVGIEGAPGRAQHLRQRTRVGARQRCRPTLIRGGKGIGIQVGARCAELNADGQLGLCISGVKHSPYTTAGSQVGETVTGDNDNQRPDGMGADNGAGHGGNGNAVDKHSVAVSAHHVTALDEQQALTGADCARRYGLACHLQGFFLFAHV